MEDGAMRLPRMTTRRWMIAIVVAAVLARAAHEAERYCRLRSRHAAALRGYKAAMHWFDEGRLDLVKSVLASQRLLEAELALSLNDKDHVTAISARLKRAYHLIEAERNEPFWTCHDNRDMWIGEAEATLAEWKARLKTMREMR
jgi:hypothetical protein